MGLRVVGYDSDYGRIANYWWAPTNPPRLKIRLSEEMGGQLPFRRCGTSLLVPVTTTETEVNIAHIRLAAQRQVPQTD
jgi:hypothetical protein